MKMQRRLSSYEWGTVLDFGITGNGDVFLGHGWSAKAPTFHWSIGRTAEMVFAVEKPERDVRFKIVFTLKKPD